ncbi:MAG: hypothetical protein ACOY90_13605 [Candidatus Zhuqueibacterota bacterium]
MSDSENIYPEFEFTVEGFEKLRKYGNEINGIEDRIDFYKDQIKKYDEQHSKFLEIPGINLRLLVTLEKDYWEYIIGLSGKTKKPKHEDGDSIADEIWINEIFNSSVLKIYFREWELFDYDLNKIKEHSKEIGSIYNQLIYLRYVYKEFRIQSELYGNNYTRQMYGNFKSKILERIKALDKKINEVDKATKKRPQHRPTSQTDLEKLLYFAQMLEKLRNGKTNLNYNGILNNIVQKYDISEYTLVNWLNNHLRYLKNDKKIIDLTEEDMRFLWHKHKNS